MQIVCISCTLWERSVRFQRLTAALDGAEVLFFEPEQPLFSKLRRPREGLRLNHAVTAYTLPASVPPGEEGPSQINQRSRRNAVFVRRCLQEQGWNMPVLWLTCPDQAGLLYELSESVRGVIYDCHRDWMGFPYDWEAAVAEESDVILAASPLLQERLSPFSGSVALLPNGVDYEHFSQAAEGFPALPVDLERLGAPVIGFLGEVDGFTLLAPVYLAAEAHPDWSFVFVGPCSRRNPDFTRLNRLENVHFLGEKSPSTLSRYLSGFDVCFSLLSERDRNPSVVPEQIYQYLSSGKPTILFSGGLLDDFQPELVKAAHFDYEFSVLCETMLEVEADPVLRVERMAFARESDWQVRGQQLRELLAASGLGVPGQKSTGFSVPEDLWN